MKKAIYTANHTATDFSGKHWAKAAKMKPGQLYHIEGETMEGNFDLKETGLIQERSAFIILDYWIYEIRGCHDNGEETTSNVDNPTFWTLYGLRENTVVPIWEALYDYPTEEEATKILNQLK